MKSQSLKCMYIWLTLAMMPMATLNLHAQAITPDPEPRTNDTACLGLASIGDEDQFEFETFMTSAIHLSPQAKTATLPMHKGFDAKGNPVYCILTESSDCSEAKKHQINYSPKLGFLLNAQGAPGSRAVQPVTVDKDGAIHFAGTADFSPVRIFTPSIPDGWPPAASVPGSIGDSKYTPFITYVNEDGKHVVFNASQVANATGIKDFIPRINLEDMNVTFNLVMGIYDFNFVMYLRMDASDPMISGFEGGIYAPNPQKAPIGGDRFFADKSARQVIMPVLNGVDQFYERRGLQSSALGEGDPFNVMGAKPGDDEYSPIWDITPVVWTDAAIKAGKRQRLHQDDEVRAFVQAGDLVSMPGATGPLSSDIGVKSLGIVSNCPIMLRLRTGLLPYNPVHPDQ
jgi:hypothetical protein